MASHEEMIDIRCPPEEVFDLLHDYSRRLEWDSFLRAAAILDGAAAAGVGVKTRCAARLGAGGDGSSRAALATKSVKAYASWY